MFSHDIRSFIYLYINNIYITSSAENPAADSVANPPVYVRRGASDPIMTCGMQQTTKRGVFGHYRARLRW